MAGNGKNAIGYDNLFQDNLPFRSQLLERSRGVCGACRRELHGLYARFLQKKFVIEVRGGAAVCKNVRDFAFRQYFREVIRCGVLYRAVGGAAYFARGYDIPESNSVAQEHSALFVDAFGDIFTEYRGKHAPESVCGCA